MLSAKLRSYRLTRKFCRKLWRKYTLLGLVSFVIVCLLRKNAYNFLNYQVNHQTVIHRNLLEKITENDANQSEIELTSQKPEVEEVVEIKVPPKFPPDLFTEEQRRNGFVIFHIIGMIYMFVALAVVCDEFFIPALDVITEKLEISEDVSGATFMAAGGSAPELFTSVIGVFISFDDVGIGTIVGSAVFNILFVLSMCAIFSRTVLDLTWWPLFRDVSFYSIILITLIMCFTDSIIHWYEAGLLLSWYGGYVLFMKYNVQAEHFVKNLIKRAKNNNKVIASENDMPDKQHRKMSTPIIHGGSKFRKGVMHLMIHSVDPLHEEVLKKASTLPLHNHPIGTTSCSICNDSANGVNNKNRTFTENMNDKNKSGNESPDETHFRVRANSVIATAIVTQPSSEAEKEEPLDVSWPPTFRKRITYVCLALIIIPLWLTLPDVRKPEKRKWFVGSFVGSILWIAFFSYLMVWWATLAGEAFDIPSEIMGLTFLAAGTSIPDLITSVLVARKGFGDMAVSSSIGSNIFDVTVGLPLPWFLYAVAVGPVKVNSQGMACSILILFIMLLFVILTIAMFKWRLNIGMAIAMFLFYFVFIILSLLLEKNIVQCSSILSFFRTG